MSQINQIIQIPSDQEEEIKYVDDVSENQMIPDQQEIKFEVDIQVETYQQYLENKYMENRLKEQQL